MKNNARRLLSSLIAVVMALGLTACGGEKEPADPNHIDLGDFALQYKGASIMKDTDGKDSVVVTLDFTNNGKKGADFLWNVFCEAKQGDTELEGAVIFLSEESYETVTDSQFTEVAPGKTEEVCAAYTLEDTKTPVKMTFSDLTEKHKGTLTIDLDTLGQGKGNTASGETDALLQFWNGDWYGWWVVTGGDGEYEQWSNQWWDCCASISVGADYSGDVLIWDESLPKDNAISEASVTLSAAGTGEYGTLTSEDGYFLDGTLSHADWIVDPAIMEYDNLICIDGWYEDADGSFKYTMYLRPWGTLWDDIATDSADDLPHYYESWYLPLINAGKAMPDVLNGETSTPAEPAAADTGTAATEGDYGKSNADATGITTLEAMQELYKLCYENRSNAYHLFNYEDAKNALGSDGVVWNKGEITWSSEKHTYRWENADGSEYFNISFSLEDGEEWYFSCNFSDNVKNNLW